MTRTRPAGECIVVLQRKRIKLLQARDAEKPNGSPKPVRADPLSGGPDRVMPVFGLQLADRLKPLRPEMKTRLSFPDARR